MSELSKEELKLFYHNKIKPRIGQLEKERKKVLFEIFICLLAITAVVARLSMTSVKGSWMFYSVIGMLISLFIVYQLREKYIGVFKSLVIKSLFESIIPECEYKHESKVSQEEFDRSDLFREDCTDYKGDDHVRGMLDGLPMEFSDLYVTRETGSGKDKTTTIFFHGLFFKFKLNKNLAQQTLIHSDTAESLFGKIVGRRLQSMNLHIKSKYDLIHLESPEFERLFAVHSDDQVKARTLLTPAVMDRLTSFKMKHLSKMETLCFSIHYDTLYVGIHNSRNHFEPRFFGSVISFKDIREIYDLIEFIREFREETFGAQKISV